MTEVKRIKCGTGNCYLLVNGRNAVLVDTGKKEHLEMVKLECSDYDLKLIVLTHPHIDHAENAATLSKQFECPVAMSGKDTEVLYNFMAQPLKFDSVSGKALYRLSIKTLSNEKVPDFNNKIFIEEGDALMNFLKPTESLIWHDKEQMRKSVDRIKSIGPRTIWFGHGNPVDSSKIQKV